LSESGRFEAAILKHFYWKMSYDGLPWFLTYAQAGCRSGWLKHDTIWDP